MLTTHRRNSNPCNRRYMCEITVNKFQTQMRQNNSTPESATDSSLDTSSIEVIQPIEGHEIKLPRDPPQRALPNSPESPRTNVAVPIPDDLLTEDEETGDQAMPSIVTSRTPDLKGRQETLSPTPQVPQMVQSAIELTVKDVEPS